MSINEKLRAIEETKYVQHLSELADMFKVIQEVARNEENKEIATIAQYEIEVLSLHAQTPFIFGNHSQRFTPMLELNNGFKFPDVEKFTVEQYKYYEQRLEETENVFFISRYSDFLFEHGDKYVVRNKYLLSQILLPTLFEVALTHLANGEYFSYLEDMARVIQVALKMKNEQYAKRIEEHVVNQIKEFDESQEYSWVLEIAKLYRVIEESPLTSIIQEENKVYCYEILDKSRQYFIQNKKHYIHRYFCKELMEWSKILKKNEETRKKYSLEIGMSYEEEAEHQQGRQDKSSIVKAHFLEEALQHYADIGEKNKIDEMKILIRRTYEEVETNGELSLISTVVSIPIEAIDQILNPYLEVEINESLNLLSKSIIFIPDLDVVMEQTKKQNEKFPLQYLASKSIIYDGKKVFQEVEEEDSFELSFISNYLMHLQETLLVRLFDKLIDENDLNCYNLLDKIKSWELLDSKNEVFIEIGIKRFFEGDYISSLHILVPQFESCLRRMFSNSGYVTTSIKKGVAQHEITFNEFLNRDDVKSSLGEIYHTLVQVVMVEQAGFNLRNKIAHGLITQTECNKSMNVLVIYLFLLLTNYRITENEV
ncbi:MULTISPECIES: DUF4209 domain-containing protein [Bacillaceae]|uniref:DUF4209 domain-containing protein n=1 Tax=Bacillaceae TaxID=186817 RepID=UPI00066047C8|nr:MULTISPECIES: DUF4209 domain-containing protein [Bacillaceae]MCF7622526.1 DUF4209 domain-containing protein [Peribacillus frigoritolerans]PRA80894.1 DUF4209 domain-containing protein [Peribacillus simplex]